MKPTRSPADSELSQIGRAAVRGGVLGFVVVASSISAAFAWAGQGAGGIGVGLFVGLFGGVGFGSMLAAMWRSDRVAKHEGRGSK